MSPNDPGHERKRPADHYSGLTDGELEDLAAQGDALTDVAKDVLRAEIARRGLQIKTEAPAPAAALPEGRRPVTVRAFRDLPEAQVAKTILESANIKCFLADENLVRMDWFYSNLIGGIKLWVTEEDLQAAQALLKAEMPEEFEVEGVGEFRQPRCPKCDSLNISFHALNRPLTYLLFLANLAIPFKRRRWMCEACGNEWRDTQE